MGVPIRDAHGRPYNAFADCLKAFEERREAEQRDRHTCGLPTFHQTKVTQLGRVLVLYLATVDDMGGKIQMTCDVEMRLSAFGRHGSLYAMLEHSGTRLSAEGGAKLGAELTARPWQRCCNVCAQYCYHQCVLTALSKSS